MYTTNSKFTLIQTNSREFKTNSRKFKTNSKQLQANLKRIQVNSQQIYKNFKKNHNKFKKFKDNSKRIQFNSDKFRQIQFKFTKFVHRIQSCLPLGRGPAPPWSPRPGPPPQPPAWRSTRGRAGSVRWVWLGSAWETSEQFLFSDGSNLFFSCVCVGVM